jgi:PAS domain S-box-containing protein
MRDSAPTKSESLTVMPPSQLEDETPFPFDGETMIDTTSILPEDSKDRVVPRPGIGADPLQLNSFHRQIKSMQWRIDALRSGPEPDSSEIFQTLETTMEELQVAVEELRQTNEALHDSRAEVEAERRRYRDLFDLAPDAYFVTDLQGIIREANRAAVVRLNIDPQFLVGKPLFVFLPEENRPSFRAEVSRLRDEARISEFDVRLIPRRLPPFDASLRVGVVRDAWGRAVALRWTCRDISARKLAEEEIKALNVQLEGLVVERSEQLDSVLQTNERWLIKAHAADSQEDDGGRFFREIIEEVDAIFWRADAETGRYTFVSRRAEELLGYPASTWLDDPEFWLKCIHVEDRDFAAAYRRKQICQGLDHESEYRVVAADGRTLWFREAVRLIRQEAGGPATLYGLMVNISKRKKVERQLYTAKGELASQLRDLSYLHDLGGRLTGARGVASTLDEVLQGVVSLQGAEMAMLWLVEDMDDDRPPALAAGLGLPDEFAPWAERAEFASKLVTARPLAIEDVETEPEESPWRRAGRVAGFRAVAVVPLVFGGGEALGAIVTAFKGPYRMGDRQARLVAMYAVRAAEAIETARELERLERSDRRKAEALARMEEPLAEILGALQAGPAGARETVEEQVRKLRKLIDVG